MKLALATMALLLTACSNPAADAPKAETRDAEPAAAAAPAPSGDYTTLNLDASSKLGFVGSKVTGSHVGGFEKVTGTIELAESGPVASRVNVEIDMNSTFVDHPKLLNHLKSDDFFDVANHPTSTFRSTNIAKSEGDAYTVTGDLTLRGVTKSITFPATITVDGDKVAVNAEFSIKRKDFNIMYPGRPDDLIRDEVLLKMEVSASATAGA